MIEGLVSIVTAVSYPDFLEIRLGSRVQRFRELVQDIERLMEPTALMTRDAELLLQRFLETKGNIADREFGRHRQAAALQVRQEFAPGLDALAKAYLKAGQLLPTFRRGANQNQNALLLDFHPGVQIDTVSPDIDIAPGGEIIDAARARILLSMQP